MRKYTLYTPLLLLMLIFSSCTAIEGIFKAGYYVGIFVVIFILFVVGFIYFKFKN